MAHRRTRPSGQQRRYGILVGTVKDGFYDPKGRSPHYEIWIEANGDYRAAVNVESVDGSDVIAYFDPNFGLPTKLNLPALAAGDPGFSFLKTGPQGQGLDYLRDNLFPLDKMSEIPPAGSGMSLANLLDGQIERAKADDQAVALCLGWFFQDPNRDPAFDFTPERGVHDIHMMQGNSGDFSNDNEVNGDGALFIRYRGGETIALFVRFSSQAVTTDDSTGAPVDG